MITVYPFNKEKPTISEKNYPKAEYLALNKQGTVVGYAEKQLNDFHPYPVRYELYGCHEGNNQPIYTALLRGLKRYHDSFKIMTYSDCTDLISALQSEQIQCKRQCYEGEEALMDLIPNKLVPMIPISQLTTDQKLLFKYIVVNEYRHYHKDVSPLNSTLSEETVYNTLTEKMDNNLSFCAIFQQKMAYFIIEKEDWQSAFITYCGGDFSYEELSDFYVTCLYTLREQGIQYCAYEIDNINDKMMVLSKFFTLQAPTFDTYIYTRPCF